MTPGAFITSERGLEIKKGCYQQPFLLSLIAY